MKSRPPSISGRRGSTTTTSGWPRSTSSRAGPAFPALPTTTRRSPIPKSPARLSRTRSSASTTRTRSGAGPGLGVVHPAHRGPPRPRCGNGLLAEARHRPKDGAPPTSSVADRRDRRRGLARARLGAGRRDRRTGARTTSMVVPLPAHAATGERRADARRAGPPSRRARDGRPGRAWGRSPCRRRRSAGGRRRGPARPRRGPVARRRASRRCGAPPGRCGREPPRPRSGSRSSERALDDDRQADPALQGRGVGLEGAGQAILFEVPGA